MNPEWNPAGRREGRRAVGQPALPSLRDSGICHLLSCAIPTVSPDVSQPRRRRRGGKPSQVWLCPCHSGSQISALLRCVTVSDILALCHQTCCHSGGSGSLHLQERMKTLLPFSLLSQQLILNSPIPTKVCPCFSGTSLLCMSTTPMAFEAIHHCHLHYPKPHTE